MKTKSVRQLITGVMLIASFIMWTILIQTIDVKPVGVNGTSIGFSTLNVRFHSFTGVNMTLYSITDWLGLVPLFVCMIFAVIGFVQLIKRKSLFKVDFSLMILGGYYVTVILCYLFFEMVPINYRPVLIDGFMEASYPSSTTLLVLSVMPTFIFQVKKRVNKKIIKRILCAVANLFSAFIVIGRVFSGVHWITDIIGAVLLSAGLFYIYKSIVIIKEV